MSLKTNLVFFKDSILTEMHCALSPSSNGRPPFLHDTRCHVYMAEIYPTKSWVIQLSYEDLLILKDATHPSGKTDAIIFLEYTRFVMFDDPGIITSKWQQAHPERNFKRKVFYLKQSTFYH